MAGYRPAAMVRTPWGDADTLRDRKLRPGQRLPAEEVARNQRERLFAALVAIVAEQGYEATRVEDLLDLSGVSRSAFYAHFRDKQDCLLAAVGAFLEPTVREIVEGDVQPHGEERARRVLDSLIDRIVDQPAAARMCFVEIFAAGPRAIEQFDGAIDAFEAFVAASYKRMPGRERMPPEVVRAVVGGLRKVMHTRLYRGEEAELRELAPQLWEWAISYENPPRPLRRPRVRPPEHPRSDGYDQAERILRALASVVAEKGYPAMTVGDVAARASISLSTFYAHFADKEEAMLAAIDSGSAQMLATTLPAFRRNSDWSQAIRSAIGSMFAFAAAEPEYTTLGAVDIYAAGKRALAQRDQVIEGMQALLAPGFERNPGMSPIAAEAIGGAIYSMIYDQVIRGGTGSMQEIVPLATYVTLAPFIGAEEACAVANGNGRGR
ncbi:MAG TPA: TetR/AcrR family transcriptional regulator [Solirubrobacterales bacterium]|jgi:AcrR family transcriptional regulator|nr:TetR/AcrR family transcriptional regulator [Solirubrobacterales bacterium]